MRTLKIAGGAALLAVVLAACGDTLPQSTFNPAGPVAQKQMNLYLVVFWIAVAVFIIVEGALLYFVVRHRRRRNAVPGSPPQIHGNTRLEIAWTIAPALLLAGVAVPTVAGIWDLAATPKGGDVVKVDVIGHQWWWEFRYPEQPGIPEEIVTANEMIIPTGTTIELRLCSGGATGAADPKTSQPGIQAQATGPAVGEPCVEPAPTLGNGVIHAFWVPRLAGKQDVVPGRTNVMHLSADEPGVYPGQCAEFCAWSHANMRFRVVAETQAEFDRWVAGQILPANLEPADTLAAQGAELISGQCIACHSLKGIPNQSTLAPDLTHFASRRCFAGCMFETYTKDGTINEEALRRWLDDPAAVKPGAWMPDYGLSPDQIKAVIAYLETLK